MAPEAYYNNYWVRDLGYMGCPLACSKYYRINDGPYAGTATEGFELQTLNSIAGKLAIDYFPAVVKAFTLLNQLGVDIDSSTTAISWAVECFEKGILTEKDTDGMKLQWGDHQMVMELIRKQAYREGFGNLLAEGSKFAADIVGKGSSYYAIHNKGQDLYEEGRSIIAWGFGAWVATRGGGHTTGGPSCEIFTAIDKKLEETAKARFGVTTLDPMSYDQKDKLVFYFERLQELNNSMGICMLASAWQEPSSMSFDEVTELYSAATGIEKSKEELIYIADRIFNLEKAFNVLHAGLGRKDDYPPERCLKEPVTGPLGGFQLTKEEYDKLLDSYYALHGWDPSTGLQTGECLEGLNLADVADRLSQAGKL
jgi:aldehyde:ferredoxin oxidoreductase